jgi:hypothetical protein
MSIKRWTFVSLTALALASCGPVLAKVTEKDVAQCQALGNIAAISVEYNAKGVPRAAAIAKAHELFEGEELKQVLAAIRAGYTAKGVPFAAGKATFEKCMENARLSTV